MAHVGKVGLVVGFVVAGLTVGESLGDVVGSAVGDVVGRAVVGELLGLSVQIGRAVEDPPHCPSPVGDGKQVARHTRQQAEVHVEALRVWGHPVYGVVPPPNS